MVVFSVPGNPQGQARPRFARVGRFVRTYDPEKSASFKNKIALFAKSAGVVPIDGPVTVSVVARMQRPKRLCRRADPDGCIRAPCKPDADNILKSVLDGLNGVAYADDSQVTHAVVSKWYTEKGGSPSLEIGVWACASTEMEILDVH
jgi:Holliday junction resolvase RusA-like endonuclease